MFIEKKQMWIYVRIVILFIILATSQISQSQFNNCLFNHYSTDDGLSHGSITTILKDSESFMWFGTMDGINRFDGYNFKTYKTRPGDKVSLSSNRINEIVEDNLGFLWIKTYDSRIYRFNKITGTFENVLNDIQVNRVFKAQSGDIWITTNTSGLYRLETEKTDKTLNLTFFSSGNDGQNFIPGDTIYFLGQDDKGEMWISTNKGLACLKYNPKLNNYVDKPFLTREPDKINNQTFQCFFDYRSNMFFGTRGGDVFIYDSNSDSIRLINLNNKSSITTIRLINDERLIIATNGNGLFSYNLNSDKIENHLKTQLLKKIRAVYIDSRDLIWLETDKPGVVKLQSDFTNIKHFEQITDVSPTLQISNNCNFKEDNNNILWINLKGSGFGYYNPEKDKLEYFFNKPGDSKRRMSNFVTTFYLDPAGIMWLSTYFKGIEKITFPDNKFEFFQPVPGAQNRISNEVRSLFEDQHSNLWLGTKEGIIYVYNNNNELLLTFAEDHNTQKGLTYSIVQDAKNNIWLGTKGKGLFKVSIEKDQLVSAHFEQFSSDNNLNSLSHNNVYSVLEDSRGRIWIATYGGGINLLKENSKDVNFKNINNSFHYYPKSDALKCRQLLEDSKGNIWIATTNGLIFFNPNVENSDSIHFKHFTKIPGIESSLGNNDVYCILNDNSNNLWFGTMGGGLNRLIKYPVNGNQPEFKIYSRSDGLPSDIILSLVADKKNNIWMSTENGISVFDQKSGYFTNYDEYDGLTSTSFSENTVLLKSNGEIIFGSFDGIYSFYPDSINTSEQNIRLKIIDFQLPDNPDSEVKKINVAEFLDGKAIELDYNENMFSIEYLGLDYRLQHKIQYNYLLEGFDESWHSAKNRRLASYTNIPPGKYQFKVKIANPEISAANYSETLLILINPPPWKTFWAYLIYLFLIIVLLLISGKITYTIIHLRHKVVLEQEMTNLKLRFFTNISHELRTPLTLIAGPIAEIAKKEKLSGEGREYLWILDKNANRMLRLINQLLDFRKLQNKKMKLKISEINLNDFVLNIVESFLELANHKQIKLKTKTNSKNVRIWADPEKLDIVIFNLLSNAIKFTPSGKEINVIIDDQPNEEYVTLEVIDQGIGIPKEKAGYVFSRYASVSDSNNLRDTGTGIGLSLSKELIELHRGSISFTSKENENTTFTVKLKRGKEHFDKNITEFSKSFEKIHHKELNMPVDLDDDSKISWGIQNSGNGSDLPKLLIVEDDNDLRQFLRVYFKKAYYIIEANNGHEGIVKALKYLPDIIISDIMMPKTDGIELTDKLKNDFKTSHIPIILLTSKSDIEDKIEGIKYGADDYLTKPFNCEYLEARIDNILKQRIRFYNQISGKKEVTVTTSTKKIITDKDEKFLFKLSQILEDNYTNPEYKIENLARDIGHGRTKLFTKLKALTGMAPVEVLKDYRLRKSVEIIDIGEKSVSEIAYAVGFSDPGYFTKCFKEKYNTTPTVYIKK